MYGNLAAHLLKLIKFAHDHIHHVLQQPTTSNHNRWLTARSIWNSRCDTKCSEVVPLKAGIKVVDGSRGASHKSWMISIVHNCVATNTLRTINWRNQLNVYTSRNFNANLYFRCRWATCETVKKQHASAPVWGILEWYGHCQRQCIEAHSDDLSAQNVEKIFSTFIFLLSGWALVVPLCFALHCHWLLLSMSSVT